MTNRSNQWVLLNHQVGNLQGQRGDHFDFMVSPPDSGPLWTWAIPDNPLSKPLISQTQPLECSVERLPDHRRVYLDYEGPISGDRGEVCQVARGSYEVVSWDDKQVELRIQHDRSTDCELQFLITLRQRQRSQDWHLIWAVLQ